jgi:hydrogenase-4 component E
MSTELFTQLLDLAVGTILLCAVAAVWRRTVRALVRILAIQGAGLGLLVAVLAAHRTDGALTGVALGVFALKGIIVPLLLGRAGADRNSAGADRNSAGADRNSAGDVETESVVNVPASLLAAAGLTALAYAVCRPIVALAPASPALQAAPIGVAVFLIGFFVLLTRRRAISQAVGFLLVDNGIATVAFLTVDGVPLVVELGTSLDLLLAVLILQVLTTRIRRTFGDTDLDSLKELHD